MSSHRRIVAPRTKTIASAQSFCRGHRGFWHAFNPTRTGQFHTPVELGASSSRPNRSPRKCEPVSYWVLKPHDGKSIWPAETGVGFRADWEKFAVSGARKFQGSPVSPRYVGEICGDTKPCKTTRVDGGASTTRTRSGVLMVQQGRGFAVAVCIICLTKSDSNPSPRKYEPVSDLRS